MVLPQNSIPESLTQELEKLKISLPPATVARLEEYVRLLWACNEKVNLTRHTTFELFARRDVLDTTIFSQCLSPQEVVLDVGTGSGIPGVLLAILRPDLTVFVCDSVQKKAAAVGAIAASLKLPVSVLAGRGECIAAALRFSTLLARAVAPLWKLLRWLRPCRSTAGRLLLIKGPSWENEIRHALQRRLVAAGLWRVKRRYRRPDTEVENVVIEIKFEDRGSSHTSTFAPAKPPLAVPPASHGAASAYLSNCPSVIVCYEPTIEDP